MARRPLPGTTVVSCPAPPPSELNHERAGRALVARSPCSIRMSGFAHRRTHVTRGPRPRVVNNCKICWSAGSEDSEVGIVEDMREIRGRIANHNRLPFADEICELYTCSSTIFSHTGTESSGPDLL